MHTWFTKPSSKESDTYEKENLEKEGKRTVNRLSQSTDTDEKESLEEEGKRTLIKSDQITPSSLKKTFFGHSASFGRIGRIKPQSLVIYPEASTSNHQIHLKEYHEAELKRLEEVEKKTHELHESEKKYHELILEELEKVTEDLYKFEKDNYVNVTKYHEDEFKSLEEKRKKYHEAELKRIEEKRKEYFESGKKYHEAELKILEEKRKVLEYYESRKDSPIATESARTESPRQPHCYGDKEHRNILAPETQRQGAKIKAEEQNVAKILSTGSLDDIVQSIHLSLRQRNYAVAKQLLENICNGLKGYNPDDFLYVWPAYQENHRLEPVLVALCRSFYQGEWDEFSGFRVYKRRFDYVSPDTAKIINGQSVRTSHALIPNDIDLSKHIASSEIIKKHSNITIINTCPYRSRNGILIEEACIVIHCGMKGFIPIDEEPFPRYIGGHPVDVREGYFKLGMNTPPLTSSIGQGKLINGSFADSASEGTESGQRVIPTKAGRTTDCVKQRTRNHFKAIKKRYSPYTLKENGDIENNAAPGQANVDELSEKFQELSVCQFGNRPSDVNEALLMGTSISKQGNMSTGTLGGFVALPDKKVGFITCAHVFGEVEEKSLSEVEGEFVCQPSDGDVSTAHRQKRRVCGRVRKSIFTPGSVNVPGVDAAVVEIIDRCPKDGQFIEVSPNQLSRAGFDPDKPPKFSAGKILKYKDIKKNRRSDLIKVGSQTGLTRGMFYLANSFVQVSNECLGLPGGKMVQFYNQIEALSFNDSTVFFDLGDSGSLVFMPLEDDELYCVGLAIGRTSYYSCLVTPIEDVLKALNLNEDSLMDFISLHS